MLTISFSPSTFTFSSSLPKRIPIKTDAQSVAVSVLCSGSAVFQTTLYPFNNYAYFYDLRSILENYLTKYNRSITKFQIKAQTASETALTKDDRIVLFAKMYLEWSAQVFLQSNFLTTAKVYLIPRSAIQFLSFIPTANSTIKKYTDCLVMENGKSTPTIESIDEGTSTPAMGTTHSVDISPEYISSHLKTKGKLLSFTVHRGALAKTFYVIDKQPNIILSVYNEFMQYEYIFLYCTTKRITNFERSTAVCNGETSFYDDTTDSEFEVETSMLQYDDAVRISTLLLSHSVSLVTDVNEDYGLPIIITDLTSEISDADNATNTIKFKYKFTDNIFLANVPSPANVFTSQYTPPFD